MTLSVEAKCMSHMFCAPMGLSELSFERPHIIDPQARKGLDELVDGGFLTKEKFNKYSDKLVWKPTDKINDLKRVSMKFLEEHSFSMTTE